MHIPNERIFREMNSEIASLWYVPATGDDDIALLVKSITTSIKAVVSGCPIELYFGKKDNYLCTGIKIKDVPDSPLFICGVQRNYEEHKALYKCLKKKRFPVFFFNEMNVCSAWSYCSISEQTAQQTLSFLGNLKSLYVGEFDAKASETLDDFQIATDEDGFPKLKVVMPTFFFCPESEEWHSIESYFLSNTDSKSVNVFNKDEGGNFENTVWSSLSYLFPDHIYKSPIIRYGETKREFTDVFAFHEYGSFIIETKDLSIISAGTNRSMDKRTAGVKKQVSKAIKQLTGAVKHFKNGAELTDNIGNIIEVDRKIVPHCIVLITELMHYGDWSEIVKQLSEANASTKSFFHLLDERELIELIKGSSNNPVLFDYNLMKRFELFKEKQSVFIRSQTESRNN